MDNNNDFNVPNILSELGYEIKGRNINVICPCCGKKKAYMNVEKGLWDCKSASCDASKGGNIVTFYGYVKGISSKEAFKELKNNNISAENNIVVNIPPEAPKRPIEEISEVYNAFLNKCTLKEVHKENLLKRGHTEEAIKSCKYKSVPSFNQSFEICKELISEGYNLSGIAGFFLSSKGSWMFMTIENGLFIPQFNENHQIFGLQIRKNDDILKPKEERYIWFSSGNKSDKGGCGVKTYVHFATDFKKDKPFIPTHKVILTEGGLKANLIHDLMPNWSVISVAGVNALSQLENTLKYLKTINVTDVVLCYDMDYKVNKDVKAAMEKTKNLILSNGFKYHFGEWDTMVDNKSLLKGLDDYLAFKLKGIIPKSKEN